MNDFFLMEKHGASTNKLMNFAGMGQTPHPQIS